LKGKEWCGYTSGKIFSRAYGTNKLNVTVILHNTVLAKQNVPDDIKVSVVIFIPGLQA
jgi:hypothetical protein